MNRYIPSLLFGFFVVLLPVIGDAQWLDWSALRNPVYQHEGWSVKDACMIYNEADSTFYLFFSAFYFDDGRERSHLSAVKTKDFRSFSDPLFLWDGRKDGWIGLCSPNLTVVQGKYILTYNSWGDKKGKPNQLFYAVSEDLEHWERDIPLAHELTTDKRAIDASLAYHEGKYILSWKGKKGKTRMACSESDLDSFQFINFGYPVYLMREGGENGMIHENYEYFQADDQWWCLTTDYAYNPYREHAPYLYKLKEAPSQFPSWLQWEDGYKITIPIEKGFNTSYAANAAFICDGRAYDGYYYMIYAGRTENKTHAKRGDNKLGLARSRDLVNWDIAGER
ncbi:MAG: hypothetical protein RIC19_12955 [Phaeodactylibacter sp.]|uniref:hypothetical protein n=1 Tax=Phaeodactylibacter sp. TaxID=1940289 RepID=UPI0032EB8E9D